MRRFVLIAVALDVAALATLIVTMHSEGTSTLPSDIVRYAFMVLATPLGWLGMWLASDIGLWTTSGVRYVIGGLIAFLPNALLWSAVICWWLDRRARKLHAAAGVGGLQS